MFHWDWAGFNGKIKSGKTLWDWMQLLIVPLVLAIGGLWFNQIQKTREHEASEQNAKIERELASDNQREALLQSYLDRMAELLLDKHLMDEEVNNKARDIARAQTLTVLSRLDPVRKGSLVQFLQEAGLIKRYKGIREDDRTIIFMQHADLRRAYLVEATLLSTDLSQTNLSKANLSRAYMFKVNLYEADLREAVLVEAFVTYADLRGANLTRANLCNSDLRKSNLSQTELDEKPTNLAGANLEDTCLTGANLTGANLHGADLRGADLEEAIVTEEQLEQAISLKGATMPDGKINE